MFAPFPFLNLVVGGSLGSGWKIMDNIGMGTLNEEKNSYEQDTPFCNYKYNLMAQLNFQFDLGFVIPGKWTHIIATSSYSVIYEGYTGASNYTPWTWMSSTKDKVNGLQYSATTSLGYELPWKWSYIGFYAFWTGYYNKNVYGKYADSFDGDFESLILGINTEFTVNDSNKIRLDASFPCNRAFTQKVEALEPAVNKTASGKEWSFNGFSIYWEYTF